MNILGDDDSFMNPIYGLQDNPIEFLITQLSLGSPTAYTALQANKSLEIQPPLNIDFKAGKVEVLFKETNPIKKLQIFKTEVKPVNYSDYKEVYTELDFTPSMAWKDTDIEPNKKYYYCFRVVNENGKMSNPTYVYQIELVKDSGVVYPIFDFFYPDNTSELQKKILEKDISRFLYLKPKTDFIIPNNLPDGNEITNPNEISPFIKKQIQKQIEALGLKEDLYSKTFKIRITSKKTNKSIDYNIKFDKQESLNIKAP